MRVMLLNPPVHHYGGVHYRMNPPLGLPILSAVLRRAGHTCEVADLEALGVSPDGLRESWRKQKDRWPDVVGITALSASARGARETVEAIGEAGYTGKIVVGGVYATLFPETVLRWPYVDMVMTGECEDQIVPALESLVRNRPSLIYGRHAPVPGGQMPIEDIPLPDWAHHNPAPTAYEGNHPMLQAPQSISMWTRGCPGACVFCGNAIFGHQAIRYRPPANIASEMADLRDRHVRSVFVYDDELVGLRLPDGWLDDVADRVGPLGLTWKAQGRCSTQHITRDVCRDLYRGGCRVVMWGVESFSPRVLRAIRKGTTPEDIWHTLRTAKAAGLRNWVFTMVGNLEEGDAELAETAKALRDAYREGLVDYRQTTVVTPLPGTELEAIQKRDGWYAEPPESGPQMHQAYAPTPWLSAERIAYWVRKFDEACPVNHVGRMAA